MTSTDNPFTKPTAAPGQGRAVLKILPPGRQVLSEFQYQYPLKLIAPDPHHVTLSNSGTTPSNKADTNTNSNEANPQSQIPVTTLFLLTYGGGLLARDAISLSLTLTPQTRLALLTQGSTKIFKVDPAYPSTPSSQTLAVRIEAGASLCYLPDPCQPFAGSLFEQRQRFEVYPAASLCVLDWVSEGRKARGESWGFAGWRGLNEVWLAPGDNHNGDRSGPGARSGKGRLLLRDAISLQDDTELDGYLGLENKTGAAGVIGTMIIYGSLFEGLREFWMREFRGLPRIGAKTWAGQTRNGAQQGQEVSSEESTVEGLLWTAAEVRGGFVLIKFSAVELDVARQWLGGMLRREGTIEREFGHQALLCLK